MVQIFSIFLNFYFSWEIWAWSCFSLRFTRRSVGFGLQLSVEGGSSERRRRSPWQRREEGERLQLLSVVHLMQLSQTKTWSFLSSREFLCFFNPPIRLWFSRVQYQRLKAERAARTACLNWTWRSALPSSLGESFGAAIRTGILPGNPGAPPAQVTPFDYFNLQHLEKKEALEFRIQNWDHWCVQTFCFCTPLTNIISFHSLWFL